MMIAEWLIVLNADGTVLAVAGGALSEWIGTRAEDRTDVPAEVRRVAATARRQLQGSTPSVSLVSTTIASTEQPVRIVVLNALPVRRTATDLRQLLESIVHVMKGQARAIEVALTLHVGQDVPRILYVDPEKIAWTIAALIGNALRFVRRGTRLRPGGTIDVRVRYVPASTQVVVEVQDDGVGIPGDVLPRLLQRSPERLHASGLALNLVQDVIAAHGGSMHLESSTDSERSGTTVRLAIPCP
jgi:signal transduction histidine kinase